MSGTLSVPTVAPARLVPEAEVRRPMFAGEVAVWLDPGQTAPDLRARGLDLETFGGPIAVYRVREAARRGRLEFGATLEESAEYATCVAAEGLTGIRGIRHAQPNYRYQHCIEPNDRFYSNQWHYPQINLPQAWDVTQGSASVIVAVIDTGIVSAHPEFQGRLTAGFDMISDPTNAGDGNGLDPNPEDVGDGTAAQPSSFHGTHVAGTIGANGNDGAGIAGVDWNCKIMPLRALGRRGGSSADIGNAILFAAGLPNASGTVPAKKADIINMSLGGPGTDTILTQACDQAAAADVLLVAAAGNDNSSQPNTPAAVPSVLSVGAVDLVKARAPYSNFSSTVDIWAPGGDMTADLNGDQFPDGVLSCMADDQGQLFFSFENGTSMASPHVAGVAALVKAANPSLTAAGLRDILTRTATAGANLPNGGRIVDALAAVQDAAAGGGGGPVTQPVLVATPTVLDFGETGTQLTLRLENRGTGFLTFVDATEATPSPWLDGTVISAAPGGNISDDRIDVVVDRSGLPAGVYSTRVTLEYSDGTNPFTTVVEVRMQVGTSGVLGDEIFVLLVDANSFETLYQVQTNALASFAYAFDGVDPGTYILVAGSDRDNDDLLGDPGELFGAWPNLDTRLSIQVTDAGALTGLDFALRELVVIQSSNPAGFVARRLR